MNTPTRAATLDLTLEEYFAAAALTGLLSSRLEPPDENLAEFAAEYALDLGAVMAAEARKRRRRGQRKSAVQPT